MKLALPPQRVHSPPPVKIFLKIFILVHHHISSNVCHPQHENIQAKLLHDMDIIFFLNKNFFAGDNHIFFYNIK